MRLGWRNPRPNDFQTPDQRPLRDLFGDLQRFMTWPHFHTLIDPDPQTVTTTYLDKTLTAIDDPYSLLRTTDVIQVPHDFNSWMFVGFARIFVTTAMGRHLLGVRVNGVNVNDLISETHTSTALSTRNTFHLTLPVKKGDTLSVAAAAPATVTISEGHFTGFFLPMA